MPCRNRFSSSLKSSVTNFGYSFLLFSDRMSIIVALWFSYSLQSQKICSSVCGPSLRWPRDTLYPLKLALTSTSGGRSVGIFRLSIKPRIFIYQFIHITLKCKHSKLTPRSGVHLEKLILAVLAKSFFVFYGDGMLMSFYTKSHQCTYSEEDWSAHICSFPTWLNILCSSAKRGPLELHAVTTSKDRDLHSHGRKNGIPNIFRGKLNPI
jgi:hypothetical protein